MKDAIASFVSRMERLSGALGCSVLALVFGLALGWWIAHAQYSNAALQPEIVDPGGHAGHADGPATIWTCSMHPQIRLPDPGKCPICFMDLIALADDGGRGLKLSPAARELAQVATAVVERRFVTRAVRLVGKLGYDERSVKHITAWVPGRLDRLFVDYTGVPVQAGDHMVVIYSPEVLTAQAELIEMKRSLAELPPGASEIVRKSTGRALESVRGKLELWGLLPEQIAEVEARGTPSDTITIYAPQGGIVVGKEAVEGMYVTTGSRIYTIADLSKLWALFDAYETDLVWLRYGQEVTFETEAFPGQRFTGRISFIDPVLDPHTRTSKVRVNVENPDGFLKPEMFARAVVYARLSKAGRVVDPELAGKWISPMHPEIVADEPGECSICGMPLVRAEALGIVAETEAEPPLVIPATAPLITGKRAVVYVETEEQDGHSYEGREIILGPRAGADYVVTSGLEEGERVVVAGNFKIDSALQIQARPSMMSMPSEEPPAREPEAPRAFQEALGGLLSAYQPLASALAGDDGEAATGAARDLIAKLEGIEDPALPGVSGSIWIRERGNLARALGDLIEAEELRSQREHFEAVSISLQVAIEAFGYVGAQTALEVTCPMAFRGRGASWLQLDDEVANPYYGSSMLRCGSITDRIEPQK